MDSRETLRKSDTNGTSNGESMVVSERGPFRKRYVGMLVGAVLVIAALIWGVKYYEYASRHQTTDDAHVDANSVTITSKIGERVDRILVDTDQRVRKGQLLIVLDNADERARVDQARANLALAIETQQALTQQGLGGITQAEASVSNAAAQVPVAQAGVSAAEAQVSAAEAQVPAAAQALAKAQADLARTQSLVSTGDLPRQQLDAARAAEAQAESQYRSASDNVNVAAANVSGAQARVGASQSGISLAQGGVQSAQGKLEQAQAPSQIAVSRTMLDIAEQNLAYTKIYAPSDGYIGEKNATVGQTIGPGVPLLTLIPNRVFITADFKETQVGPMRAGQPVDIKVDAYKGMTFHGKVIAINPASQNTYSLIPSQNVTGNFVKVTQRVPVKISIDDADPNRYPMRPGMSVETSVLVK